MLPVGNMVSGACGAAPRWRLPGFDCRPPRTSPDLGLRPVLAGPVGWRALKPRRSGGASVGIGVLAAPGLRRNIGERLGERPLMTGEVLGGVLPLAEHHVGRLHQDVRAVRAGPPTVSSYVLHPHHHGVRGLARTWRAAIPSHVADDHRPVTDPEL